ncbi:MAG TPA: membrane protein insertion efficiency factor YidD [Candidatus Woesebacteria bacterium]|nr:membrane protein insertion efficiency factor YidD [Candidatus Woesebacteria bacterium]HPJ17330.1 membrane protein insertion efficiency factor YidD [Candidatus Woesebacteria bacterium]
MLRKVVLKILIFYKRYLSRGYSCRFVPSCSEYTYLAVEKYGVIKGLWLGFKRVMRCNPWSKGGIDLVK